MKLFVIFMCALGLAISVNAIADQGKELSAIALVNQVEVQAVESNKVNTAVNKEESHQHDALKTQFLAKRPYMEIKAK